MEYPGSHCTVKTCKQNDFLPITCVHCQEIFCKNHFNILSHNCPKKLDNIVNEPGSIASKYYTCNQESCSSNSPIEMNCVECKKHYCLAHRYHGCLEESDVVIAEKQKIWDKPKEEFSNAKKTVDQQINEKLKKSKNSPLANKVQLMRLKGRAIGSKGIPTENRRYFLIFPPSSTTKDSQAVFVCKQWTVGKAIDSIADLLGIKNTNNQMKSEKLRLFHHSTGEIIAEMNDTVLSDLFNSDLIDGESLILEYSNSTTIDNSLYK